MSSVRALLSDLNPKRWLLPFASRSVTHIVLMGLFYHALGLVLLDIGHRAAGALVPGYAPSGVPISVASALASGPIEESIFFGIPYLVFSNPYILLAIGSLWSLLHLFNTPAFDFASVSYGAFLFTIPHIFFSIRTWTSGRGWVAIAFHSAWNLAVLLSACGTGAIQCRAFGDGVFFVLDVLLAIVAVTVSVLIYFAYRLKQGSVFPRAYYAAVLAVLLAAAVPIVLLNVMLFF